MTGIPFPLDARHPHPPANPGDALALRVRAYDHPDSRVLLLALHAEQHERYGFADHPDHTDPTGFAPDREGGVFLVGYLDAVPVACGGWRPHGGGVAEVKSMFVTPAARGRGHGRQLLAELEQHAAQAGRRELLLETGARNTEALALYRAAGYRPVPSYVPGRDRLVNRALAKTLPDNRPGGGPRGTGSAPLSSTRA